MTCCILDKNGKIINRSKNLAGIRRYVSNHIITQLDMSELPHEEGKLSILFDDGSSFETNFASFVVLRQFVAAWHNVRGAPMSINGVAIE